MFLNGVEWHRIQKLSRIELIRAKSSQIELNWAKSNRFEPNGPRWSRFEPSHIESRRRVLQCDKSNWI